MWLLAAAVAAGLIGPHEPTAVAGTSPSEHACATAFDSPSNAAVRARLARVSVLRVEIFATTIPSCLVKFQLPAQQVLTAQTVWSAGGTAVGWTVSSNPHGLVAGANARWQAGRLTAIGPGADRVYATGPGPTVSTCMDAWNLAPPSVPAGVAGSKPVVVDALNGGISFGNAGQTPIAGNACTIWIVESPQHVLLIAGAWSEGRRGSWRAPERTDGLIAGATPNATLGRDEKLTARAATPIQLHPKASIVPRVSHTIGATGWAGGVHLQESLAQAIGRLGSPSTELPVQFGCQFFWPALHLSVVFGFGRGVASAAEPCGKTAIALGFTGGTTWSTTRGLRVGEPESDIALRYPGAGHSTSADVTTWYLSPRHASNSAITLTAQATLGTVTSITISTGSTAFGAVSA
jgi:hypothetical protein